MLTPVELSCPYCGETFESSVDTSAGDQLYIEDCQICCQPIQVRVSVDVSGELQRVDAVHQDEATGDF